MAKSSIKGIKKQYNDIGAKIDDLSKTIGTFSSNLKQVDALTMYAVMHELMENYVKKHALSDNYASTARNEFLSGAVNALNSLSFGEEFREHYRVDYIPYRKSEVQQ